MPKREDIVDALMTMTVREALKLARALEATWGVEAVPIAGRAMVVPADPDSDWPYRYEVVLMNGGPRPADVIGLVRELTGLDEAIATHVVEGAPQTVMDSRTSQQAAAMKQQLEAAGATVEIK